MNANMHTTMNDAALARATAALLHAALPLLWFNLLVLLGSLWLSHSGFGLLAVWIGGLLALYYQWRIRLDAALFSALATETIDTGQLDGALLALGLRHQLASRSMTARTAGALGLLRRWLLCSLMQTFGIFWTAWAA